MQAFKDAPILVKILMVVVIGTLGIAGYMNSGYFSSGQSQVEPNQPGDSELQNVKITVQEKLAPNLVPNVDVQIISDGPPTSKKTDSNGYFEIEIPTRKTVTIILKKTGYKPETYSVNLQVDPKTTRTFYMGTEESSTRTDSSPSSVSSLSPSASPTISGNDLLPNSYYGSWTGQVNQKNSQDNSSELISIKIVLKAGSTGSKVGEFNVRSNRVYCNGVLVLRNAKPDFVELFETITLGTCISNGTMTLKRLGQDFLDFKWTAVDFPATVTGNLTREN